MLGPTYRVVAVNNQGASTTVTAKIKRSKFNSDATPEFESSPVTLLNAVSVGAGSNSTSATVDNTTNKWLFGEVEFTVTATTTGNVALYLSRSVDGGTTFPDAGKGQLIGSIDFTAGGTQRRVFTVE